MFKLWGSVGNNLIARQLDHVGTKHCTIIIPSMTLTCRYASLYFCVAIDPDDNELITLEIIHRYVELLDKYFGSVSGSVCTLS